MARHQGKKKIKKSPPAKKVLSPRTLHTFACHATHKANPSGSQKSAITNALYSAINVENLYKDKNCPFNNCP